MNNEQVIKVLNIYGQLLTKIGAKPVRNESPEDLLDITTAKDHLLWMTNEAQSIASAGRTEKAMRWLGFLQGALWAFRLRTLEEMKHDNAPPDAVFDAQRV